MHKILSSIIISKNVLFSEPIIDSDGEQPPQENRKRHQTVVSISPSEWRVYFLLYIHIFILLLGWSRYDLESYFMLLPRLV